MLLFCLIQLIIYSNLSNCSGFYNSKMMNEKKKITYSKSFISEKTLKQLMISFTHCFFIKDKKLCNNGRGIESFGIENSKKFIIKYSEQFLNKKNIITQVVPYNFIKKEARKYNIHIIDNKQLESYNIITYIKSKRKNAKFIIFSAHYDHEGVHNGEIMYGADDNASGVIALLKISETIQKMNSNLLNFNLLFLYCTGEEKGLIGSKYFTENLIKIPGKKKIKLSDILLNINIDMKGRNCSIKENTHFCSYKYTPFMILTGNITEEYLENNTEKDLFYDETNKRWRLLAPKEEIEQYVEKNKKKKFIKILNKMVDYTNQSNNNLGNQIKKIDSTTHHLRNKSKWVYRTDSYNFYQNGIPSIFFSGGDHPDYHKPSDTYDKIRYKIYRDRILIILNTFLMLNEDKELYSDISH